MPIRHRLRSKSQSTEHKETSNYSDNDYDGGNHSPTAYEYSVRFGECELCQQHSNSDGNLLLTCSVCATQYHPKCLDLNSQQLKDAHSQAFENWVCKNCIRCLFCRRKKVKIVDQTGKTFSSLRSKSNSKNEFDKMIHCHQCDASIHAFCLHKLLQQRFNLQDVSVREFRRCKNSFICDSCQCIKHESIDEEESDEESAMDFDEEGDEDYDEETRNMPSYKKEENEPTKLFSCKKRSDKDLPVSSGVSSNINNLKKHEKLNCLRSSILRSEISNHVHDNEILSSSLNIVNNIKQQIQDAERKNENESQTSQVVVKKRGRGRPRKNDSKTKTLSETKTENTDLENNTLTEIACTVPGCDSRGHLSGMFEWHATVDNCPLFHNVTPDECIHRYQQRCNQQLEHCQSGTIKRENNCKTGCGLDQKWRKVTEKRKAESFSSPSQTDTNSMTSSRQPSLKGLTSSFDLDLFMDAQSRAAEMIRANSSLELNQSAQKLSNHNQIQANECGVQSIILGQHEISVCYSSPYSDDFQNCLKLFICEFCLKCMNSSILFKRHMHKCTFRHPPGNEIYRNKKISFFEIDGNLQKEYCQNLCLLAKLFIEHKTLFFDVEPFLFYVMTVCDDEGMHIVGYFSKEKHSVNNYNVSCILTLPHYQRHGYGRMLIEFSYLLTVSEGKVGSPERPLSDLGLMSYRSYWKYIIMNYLSTCKEKEICLKDLSQKTGINSNDLVSTLQLMGNLKYWKDRHLILLSKELRASFCNEIMKKTKINGENVIDPKCLVWKSSTS